MNDGSSPGTDAYGKSIPLTAIPSEQMAVIYPIAHIGALMRRASDGAAMGRCMMNSQEKRQAAPTREGGLSAEEGPAWHDEMRYFMLRRHA